MKWSIAEETIASITEIEDVIAATATIIKKTAPIKSPSVPIELNTFGKFAKINPGPADIPSFPAKAYTAGIIIRPARKAIAVSKISI